jgi:hypothetical protein
MRDGLTQHAFHTAMASAFLGEIMLASGTDKLTPEKLVNLRAGAVEFMLKVPFLCDAEVPDRVESLAENPGWIGAIRERLAAERATPGGEPLALTCFLAVVTLWQLHLFAVFEPESEISVGLSQNLRVFLRELAVEPDAFLERTIKRAAEAVTIKDGEEFVRDGDRLAKAMESVSEMLESSRRALNEPLDTSDRLADLAALVTDRFTRLETQSVLQHAAVIERLEDLRDSLVGRLEREGVPAAEARELADTSTPTFRERLTRWASSGKARDAAEAALWAALDFVPAGTAVKLGIKVAGAMRKAVKD